MITTSFNKIKFKYLIQVWEDVMKIIRNVKNVNVEKLLWWRHHLKYPPSPMSPSVTILGYPSPSPLRWRPFWTTPEALTLQAKCMKNISLYYNRSINWGDTSNLIANVGNFFVCCDKFLEGTIESFQGKYLRRSSFLVTPLSLRFTAILLLIVKLMILWTSTRDAVVWRCSVEKIFLRISQYSQEDICVGVSF